MTKIFSIVNWLFLLCLIFSSSIQADTVWQEKSSQSLQIILLNNPVHLQELDQPAMLDFYSEHKFQPLWSDAKGPLHRAFDLLHIIINAEAEGLDSSDYYLEEIRQYWASSDDNAPVYLDLFLSAALYRYSHHIFSGKFKPHDLDADWHIENEYLDTHQLFTKVAQKKSIAVLLDELPPQHSGYQLLKKQLRRLREIEQQSGWGKFDKAPILRPGVQHKQVVQLRQRLEADVDRVRGSMRNMDIYDYSLAEAVKIFQKRHGLTIDGRVGAQTRRALNITVAERSQQIRTNMERWRWMPRTLGRRYLMVNMTGFELSIVEKESSMLVMPVIIGKSYRSTPSFSGILSSMEYNPYWTIPESLALKDIIPQQTKDPSYLEKKAIKLFRGWAENAQEIDPQTVNWSQISKDHFPYWFRQEPGDKNSLGRVKFLFSNPYNIYLHGTPDIQLFDRVVRAFSSGCIRVKDPVKLASYLLNDGSQQMEEDILANIYLADNQTVLLPIAVPIYLVYWTSWVDQQGELNFRDDIYDRDAKLKALF